MRLRRFSEPVEAFLARPVPPDLAIEEVWSYSPPGRCLVLGSSQRDEIADLAAAERAGVQVATRRSGGGAVYVDPARCVWVDVVLPPHDRRWSDDVRAATTWLGEAWQRALATIGLDARLHRGGLEQTPWGHLVCFAAVGPGEALIEDRKAVGISQRRTRAGARFQCIAYDRWKAADVLDLLDLSAHDRAAAAEDLATRAIGIGPRVDELRSAVIAELLT